MTADAETMAGLLTPLAPGAIAVIGLAGPDVDSVLRQVLRKRHGHGQSPELRDHVPTLCRLVDAGEILDDVIVVRTRRDDEVMAQLHLHGGVRIAQRALVLLERCGASRVDGKVLASRFAPADPVERDADETLLGVSSRRLTCWLLAQRRILGAYLTRLDTLDSDASAAFGERSRIAMRLVRGVCVALVGPTNSGKSTLANRLIGRDRVITSDEAGTTRDWVAETALIRGWPVTLTDTAGLREGASTLEAEAIRRGREQAARADLVLIVLDAAAPPPSRREHWQRAAGSIPANCPIIVVSNKCDIVTGDSALRSGASPVGTLKRPLPVSALEGSGIDALESLVESTLGFDRLRDDLPTAFLPHQLRGVPSST